MLFKPDENGKVGEGVARIAAGARRRTVSLFIGLVIIAALGWLAWSHFYGGQSASRTRPDMAVPVLAATPKVEDVPVYLDGVGQVRALNTVTVRAQVDGKLLKVNFTEGQDVKAGDVLDEIDPVIYQAQYDQAVANNAQATLGYTKIVAPLSGRTGLRQVDPGNIVHASDTTGVVVLTQLQPIAVQFSLPQQEINRVNAASAKGKLSVDVFGNDGQTVVDTGIMRTIDNQVDPATGTVKVKAEFPNPNHQLWPGQFVNVRLKVETLPQALTVPTAAVQRGPSGTFSYVIGENNIVTAKAVTVTQQDENTAVLAHGLSPTAKVVTTGFANLSDGSKVTIGSNDNTPAQDLAPRKREHRGGKGGGRR